METNPTLDTSETEFTSTEWTDEKHSLYLKGMEASFVNQLYASSDLIGRHAKRDNSLDPKLPRQKQCNTGQFKVFQGGNWKKVSYGRNKGDDSHHLQANPWIQRFRPGGKPQAVADPTMQEATESMNYSSKSRGQMFSTHSQGCHQDMDGSENEVSDQNFVGEDIEGERENSTCAPKRMKRMETDDLENDEADSSS